MRALGGGHLARIETLRRVPPLRRRGLIWLARSTQAGKSAGQQMSSPAAGLPTKVRYMAVTKPTDWRLVVKSCRLAALPNTLYSKPLTPLEPQSRFGDKLLIFRVVCPHIWEWGSKRVKPPDTPPGIINPVQPSSASIATLEQH